MNIIRVKNNRKLSEQAAQIFIEILNKKAAAIVGLATGSTPERMYDILVEKNKQNEVSFSNVTTFNLDEYVGLSGDDRNSYRHFMNEHLFNRININKENTYIPNGLATDLVLECHTYEKLIKQFGEIDLQILGLGLNGHIGFNEPGTAFTTRTHMVELNEMTRKTNARFFPHIDAVPTQALTMGIATIMEAKKVLLLVQGEKKADILNKVVHGNITEEIPASILQRHSDVTVITDIDM